MIPAAYLSKSHVRRRTYIPGRLFLFVGVGTFVACFLAESSFIRARAPIAPILLFDWMLLFLMFGLAVFLSVVRSRETGLSLPSETKNLLIWQDQFANNQSPLVLIADDDVFMRSALDFHLTRAGFRVQHAANGSEAVAKATKQTAVVLLDLVMPDTNGFYCLRDIRKSAPTAKIIVLTRKRHAQDAALCRKLGAYDSLPKPLDPNDVVEMVARAVNNEPVVSPGLALSA